MQKFIKVPGGSQSFFTAKSFMAKKLTTLASATDKRAKYEVYRDYRKRDPSCDSQHFLLNQSNSDCPD